MYNALSFDNMFLLSRNSFLLVVCVIFSTKCLQVSSKHMHRKGNYRRCPEGKIFNGQQIVVVTTRSKLDCVIRCSQTADCRGINVCPDTANKHVECTMLSQQNASVCAGLYDANNTTCFFAQRTCENGGQLGSVNCTCSLSFIGAFCERYIRDCQEAYENGWRGQTLTGFYHIQPVSAPAPFQVECDFLWNGITIAFKRSDLMFRALRWDWSLAKKGQYSSDKNFFVGLENLHHLSSQAQYRLQVQCLRGGKYYGYYYQNFTVAEEAADYETDYSGHHITPSTKYIEAYFFGMTPLAVFCSDTRDRYDCARSRGAPGWYGSDCKGDSLFGSSMIVVVNGSKYEFANAAMRFLRIGSFN